MCLFQILGLITLSITLSSMIRNTIDNELEVSFALNFIGACLLVALIILYYTWGILVYHIEILIDKSSTYEKIRAN